MAGPAAARFRDVMFVGVLPTAAALVAAAVAFLARLQTASYPGVPAFERITFVSFAAWMACICTFAALHVLGSYTLWRSRITAAGYLQRLLTGALFMAVAFYPTPGYVFLFLLYLAIAICLTFVFLVVPLLLMLLAPALPGLLFGLLLILVSLPAIWTVPREDASRFISHYVLSSMAAWVVAGQKWSQVGALGAWCVACTIIWGAALQAHYPDTWVFRAKSVWAGVGILAALTAVIAVGVRMTVDPVIR
jgi:hypothetical protein